MFLITAAEITLSFIVFAAIITLVARAIRPALAQASAAQVIKLERSGAARLIDEHGSCRAASRSRPPQSRHRVPLR